MSVLLTRATGFVGGPVLRVLLEHGHMVVAVVRNAESAAEADGAGTEPITGDIRNPSRARRLRPVAVPAQTMKVLADSSIDPIADPTRPDKEPVATTCAQAL
ncbi:NAD(P)H-binding protein [Streptomyces sp. NPDC001970]